MFGHVTTDDVCYDHWGCDEEEGLETTAKVTDSETMGDLGNTVIMSHWPFLHLCREGSIDC